MSDVDTNKDCTGVSVRKFNLQILAATAIYIAVVVMAMLWIKLLQPPAPWKYIIAALPVLPALLYPATVLHFIRSQDELHQKIYMDSFAFAFVGTAILTLAYGFLEAAGLPRLSWVLVWPLMAVLWTIGLFAASARYR